MLLALDVGEVGAVPDRPIRFELVRPSDEGLDGLEAGEMGGKLRQRCDAAWTVTPSMRAAFGGVGLRHVDG